MSEPAKPGRRLVVDITPLRESPRFRILFLGQLLAHFGRQITIVAVPYQLFLITGSTLAVGVLGIVQFVPLMAASLLGGAVADAFDRRKLLVAGHLMLAVTAVGLMWNASVAMPSVWPLYTLSALNAGISAINGPARMAAIPALLRRQLLPSGLALNSTMHEVAAAVGPALAGLLIARQSLQFTYAANALIFAAAALTLVWVGPLHPEGGGRAVSVSSVTEGLRYLKGQPLLQSGFLIDLNAMIFGMPQALFPAIGTDLFGGDATTVGLLYAAPGVGALIAALTSGWVGPVSRRGRVVVISVIVWGIAITVFGLVSYLPVALVLLALAGGADVVSAVFRNTILQLVVPDALRGRLSSVHTAVVGGGPRLGDLEAGGVASLTSVRFSVVSGGLACILGALAISRFMPQLWAYRDELPAEELPDDAFEQSGDVVPED
ncbi:MAG TPA: MFS transporter [Acidimicrobiia bacterium]|jgi:MFS family permease|nr:MFS transporter [Acidimicrobiia bacterium]